MIFVHKIDSFGLKSLICKCSPSGGKLFSNLGLGLLLAVLLLSACKETEDAGDLNLDTGTESACPWDDDNEGGDATPIASGKEVEGYVCPRADEDWYAFAIPDGENLVSVTMRLDAPVSPLDLGRRIE